MIVMLKFSYKKLFKKAKIEENSSYFVAERAWNTLTDSEKKYIKLVP